MRGPLHGSAPSVCHPSRALPVQPQLGPQLRGQRLVQPLRQLLHLSRTNRLSGAHRRCARSRARRRRRCGFWCLYWRWRARRRIFVGRCLFSLYYGRRRMRTEHLLQRDSTNHRTVLTHRNPLNSRFRDLGRVKLIVRRPRQNLPVRTRPSSSYCANLRCIAPHCIPMYCVPLHCRNRPGGRCTGGCKPRVVEHNSLDSRPLHARHTQPLLRPQHSQRPRTSQRHNLPAVTCTPRPQQLSHPVHSPRHHWPNPHHPRQPGSHQARTLRTTSHQPRPRRPVSHRPRTRRPGPHRGDPLAVDRDVPGWMLVAGHRCHIGVLDDDHGAAIRPAARCTASMIAS